MEEEVTAAQAAQLTGLSERTIRRRIASRDIPARHVARNRYAIRVRDLPIRRPAEELMARLQALEYRVRVLELQQQRLLAQLDTTGAAPTEASGQEAAADVGGLLAQLAYEVRRLGPLLSAAAPESPSIGRHPRAQKADTDHVGEGQEAAEA
ncbi:MAG TPA: helix-turn-helix domain-containing protein [Ktedonobacterales bacterium]